VDTPARSDEDTPPDWLERLEALERGDLRAVLDVSQIIHSYLARYSGTRLRDIWADISQEVIVKLIRTVRKQQIREPKAVVAFIGVVTRNELSSYLRRRQKGGASLELWEDPSQAETSAEALFPWEARARWDRDLILDAERALHSLPEKTQAVLRSIYYHGRSYEETAQVLGLPVGTVNRTRTEGMRELRRILEIEV